MFKNIKVFDLYSKIIYEEVYRDRHEYVKYFKEAEEYISKHDIIITNISAYKILIHQDLNPNEFQYNLLCKNVFSHAKALATAFYKLTKNVYIYVQTKILNHEVSIFVDERELFIINSIESIRNQNVQELINPVRTGGLYSSEMINVISPELLLIDIFRSLSSPVYAKKWEEYSGIMIELFKIFSTRQEELIKGNNENSNQTEEMSDLREETYFTGSAEEKEEDESLTKKLLELNKDPQNKTILHLWSNRFVSSLPAHALAEQLNTDEFFEDQSSRLPNDFRLRRITFYKNKQAIAYIYNSMQYDIMNESHYTVLRFLLIDLWLLRMVVKAGRLPNHVAKSIKSGLIDLVNEEYTKVTKIIKESNYLSSELFPEPFHGIYYNEQIAKKKLMLESRGDSHPIPNWYPAVSIVTELEEE